MRSASGRSPIWPAFPNSIRVGGDYEIFGRPEWRALRKAYGLNFREERQMQPIFMYKAVADGEVDVITAFSSDGRIAEYGLVTLEDPKQAIPPYDAILLVSPKRSHDPILIGALQPLIGRIPIEKMRAANLAVSRDENQLSPAAAARLLWQEISGARAFGIRRLIHSGSAKAAAWISGL